MERIYLQDLENWKDSPSRKPLIVWGARQVGKSYLIKNLFAERHYKGRYIYIDCRIEHDFVSYCETHVNAEEVLRYLSLSKGMKIDKDVLLIFDEAQECLPVITLLKYFCQDHREIPVIVTGSMVRIRLLRENNKRGKGSTPFLFPIGKIQQLTIYPMGFEEYLMNQNPLLYQEIEQSFEKCQALDRETHEMAIAHFYDYLLIGGMPEVVETFMETNSYQESRLVLADLYGNYLADMSLYQASPESVVRATKAFRNIFTQLNKDSKNWSPSLLEKKAKNRDFKAPLDWLELAFLVHKSALLKERVTLPLLENTPPIYRLYLSDVGMFSWQSGIRATDFVRKDGRNELSGIFYENYVADELVRAGFPLFFWQGKSSAEFEFLIDDGKSVVPIDVKKSRGSLRSLDKFKEHNEFSYALKICLSPFGKDEERGIYTIPFYDVPFLLRKLHQKKTGI